jgi:hypothetical protein
MERCLLRILQPEFSPLPELSHTCGKFYCGGNNRYSFTLSHGFFCIAPVILSPGRDMMAYFSEPGFLFPLMARNSFLMLLFYVDLLYFTPKFFTTARFPAFFVIPGLMILIIGTLIFLFTKY